MRQACKTQFLILDACVLIDFIKANRDILILFSKHVGILHVISPVAQEISTETEDSLKQLGIIIIEPEIEDAFTAATKRGALSFQDTLCLLTAKRRMLTCVTNDKTLRNNCENEGISVKWGLQFLVELHKAKGISISEALKIGHDIQKSNSKYITKEIMVRFEKSLHS
jgi:predicted nucleic acid-binding protein